MTKINNSPKAYVVYKSHPTEYVKAVTKSKRVKAYTIDKTTARRFTLAQARDICQNNNEENSKPMLFFALAPEAWA